MKKIYNDQFVQTIEPEFNDFMARAETIRWSPADIAYDKIDYSKLTREDLFAVFVTLHIENYSDVYTKLLINAYTDVPLVRDFVLNWEREEENHARALERYLMQVGFPLEELRANYAKVNKDDFPVPSTNQSGLNVFVFIQELLTREMYVKVLKTTKEPVLTAILKRVVRDEERHYRFYKHSLALRMKIDQKETLKQMLKVIRIFGMPQTMFRQQAMTDQLMEYFPYQPSDVQSIIDPILKFLAYEPSPLLSRWPRLQKAWQHRRAFFFAAQSPYLWGHLKIMFLRKLGLGAVSKKDKSHVASVVERLDGMLRTHQAPLLEAAASGPALFGKLSAV